MHLIEHIRRFGPPLLFATETFESFNGVIRSFSIHSNRQAPSRDIAIAFANANRIRHLTSGGKFHVASTSRDSTFTENDSSIPSYHDYQVVGEEVLNLIKREDRVFKAAFSGPNTQRGYVFKSILWILC